MNVAAGSLLIAGGSLAGLAIALGLGKRLARAFVLASMAFAGVLVGAGAMLVQPHASAAEWVLTVAVLGILAPVNARAVLGPLGRGDRAAAPSGRREPDGSSGRS